MMLFQHDVFESVQSKVSFDVWDNVTYKDNLIKLEIYFEEFNFEEISETPSYVVSILPTFPGFAQKCWNSIMGWET